MRIPWMYCLLGGAPRMAEAAAVRIVTADMLPTAHCWPDEITLYRNPLDVHLVGRKYETVYIYSLPYFMPHD